MTIDVALFETMPSRVSMRRSSLKSLGGDLDNLWDSDRFESGGRSRDAGHACRKDLRCNAHVSDVRRARRQIRTLMGKD